MQLSKSFPANTSLEGVSLGFNARSVIIDNPTGAWWYVRDAQRYIQPFTTGNVVSLNPSQVGNIEYESPPGRTQGGGANQTAYAVWYESGQVATSGTAIPDAFTYSMSITAVLAIVSVDIVAQTVGNIGIDIRAQTLGTINVNIAASAVILNINISSSSVLLGVIINSAVSVLDIRIVAQTINIAVSIVASSVTINVAIVSASVTFNVAITSSAVTLNVAIQSSIVTLSVQIASSLAILSVSLTSSLITLNVNITGSVQIGVAIQASTVTLDIRITGSTVSLNVIITGQTVTIDMRIVASSVTLNVAIASSAVTLNVNIAASAATVSISLVASSITVAISAITLPWDTVSENLLNNPSFETGTATGWSNLSMAGAYGVDTVPHGGTYSLRTSPNAPGGVGEARNTAVILCTAGQKIEATGWGNGDANVANAQIQIAFWSYSGALVGTAVSPAKAGPFAYAAMRSVGIAPTGTYYATFGFLQTNGAAFGIMEWDEAVCVRQTAVTLGMPTNAEYATLRGFQIVVGGTTAALAVGAAAVGGTYTVAAGRRFLIYGVSCGQATVGAVGTVLVVGALRIGGVAVGYESQPGGFCIIFSEPLIANAAVVCDMLLTNGGAGTPVALTGQIWGVLE